MLLNNYVNFCYKDCLDNQIMKMKKVNLINIGGLNIQESTKKCLISLVEATKDDCVEIF